MRFSSAYTTLVFLALIPLIAGRSDSRGISPNISVGKLADGSYSVAGPMTPEQIIGTVTFQDQSAPQGNPNIYCYYEEELKQTVVINSNGDYTFFGQNEDWPTDDYFVETQEIWKRGRRYYGSRWVSHVEGTTTEDQDITLYEIVE